MKPNLKIVPDEPARATPILKWCGGKAWFVEEHGDDMFEHVIKQGGRFIEPFLGGGAMALHLGLEGMILSDAEPELSTLYPMVRDDPDALIETIEELIEIGTDEDTYYKVRAVKLAELTLVEQAARTVYLNKLGYNGLFRKNASGGFNVPYGQNPKRTVFDPDIIRAASRALAGAKLPRLEVRKKGRVQVDGHDFAAIIVMAKEGDTVYADPPYHKAGVKYTKGGFNESDHERLATSLYYAKERGASFFAHNADTDMVRYWYEEWAEIIPMAEKRRINSKGSERGDVPCVLIVGGVDE